MLKRIRALSFLVSLLLTVPALADGISNPETGQFINGAPVGSATPTAGNLLIGSGTQWVTHAVTSCAITSAGALTCPISTGVSGLGTGVATALALNVGGGSNAGSLVLNGSANNLTVLGGAGCCVPLVMGTAVTIAGANQARLGFFDNTGTSTFKAMALTYDGKNSLTQPGLVLQILSDTGPFVSSSGVIWRDGALTTGSTTYPGEAGSIRDEAQFYIPNVTTSSAAATGSMCWTTVTGKMTVDTTVACLTSVARSKDVQSRPSPEEALKLVRSLSPVSFRYKKGWGDSGMYEQFGLIAEEVADVDERMAGRDTEGTLTGVRYQELTAVLAGAVKALAARVEEMESRR